MFNGNVFVDIPAFSCEFDAKHWELNLKNILEIPKISVNT